MLSWSYGLTTVPSRLNSTLPITLESLAKAGFDNPRLFIDDVQDISPWTKFGLEISNRYPRIKTFGNWYLGLLELYMRVPNADRYALFQDDFLCCSNLREYLETSPYPAKGYLNLYTFPQNEPEALRAYGKEYPPNPESFKGWYKSNQLGKGALALVFSNEAVRVLMTQQHLVDRAMDLDRGWKKVDGGVVTAMVKAGWSEYVHSPSLTQHIGWVSSMGNRQHPQSVSFPGEDFNPIELLASRTV